MANQNVLDDVFDDFVNGIKLFKDREVLRHDYLPEKLPHREQQIKLLGQTVAPVLRNSRCSNIFIYGKTGTGKSEFLKEMILQDIEAGRGVCAIECGGVVSEGGFVAGAACEPQPAASYGVEIAASAGSGQHGGVARAAQVPTGRRRAGEGLVEGDDLGGALQRREKCSRQNKDLQNSCPPDSVATRT